MVDTPAMDITEGGGVSMEVTNTVRTIPTAQAVELCYLAPAMLGVFCQFQAHRWLLWVDRSGVLVLYLLRKLWWWQENCSKCGHCGPFFAAAAFCGVIEVR